MDLASRTGLRRAIFVFFRKCLCRRRCTGIKASLTNPAVSFANPAATALLFCFRRCFSDCCRGTRAFFPCRLLALSLGSALATLASLSVASTCATDKDPINPSAARAMPVGSGLPWPLLLKGLSAAEEDAITCSVL
jgi:hypothetical protein